MSTNKRTISSANSVSTSRNEMRVETLHRFYDIKGDGVAHAKIGAITSSSDFRKSVNKLSSADLNKS